MLNESILQINRLAPRFVVLTGDMQNCKSDMQHCNGGQGAMQVTAVKNSMSNLDPLIGVRTTIPGNHDIGDAPSRASLDVYTHNWGADRSSFDEGAWLRFIALDASLYFNASHPGMQARADEQTQWLSAQLDDAASLGAIGTVVLSHIPPFIVSAEEAGGWANWPRETREHVLQLTQQKLLPPSLFICGHFHANVEGVSSAAFGSRVEVVTTSAVGSPIQWNGTTTSTLPHAQASTIATVSSGAQVFQEYVLRNGGGGTADARRIAERVQAVPTRSGVRIFEFDLTSGYRHQWFTLEQMTTLQPLVVGEASPLAGKSFTRWAQRN